MISWCNFTNNKANLGAISVSSGSIVSISDSVLTTNKAIRCGGALSVSSGNVAISNSELTNNRARIGGAICVYSGIVSIFSSELTNNGADTGGAIFGLK